MSQNHQGSLLVKGIKVESDTGYVPASVIDMRKSGKMVLPLPYSRYVSLLMPDGLLQDACVDEKK